MKNSISNDAIWEKLSEMDEKLKKIVSTQKGLTLIQESEKYEPDTKIIKDEIINEIKAHIRLLALSNESHFEANRKNNSKLHNEVLSIKKSIGNIKIPENQNLIEIKALLENKDEIRFCFGKVRKTSFIITALGTLVFILTVFCMKLYSDSLIIQNNYYRQIIYTRNLQIENDSLKTKLVLPPITESKRKK